MLPVALCAFRALLRLRNTEKGTKAHKGASRTDLMVDVTVHQLMASLVTAVLALEGEGLGHKCFMTIELRSDLSSFHHVS